jgi:hypothetical protein
MCLQDPHVEHHNISHLSPLEALKSFGLARLVGLPAFVILAAMAVWCACGFAGPKLA